MFLYALPTKSMAERVSLWRKLKKFGALQFKNSSYILPDQPQHLERFRWLAKHLEDEKFQRPECIDIDRRDGLER